MKRLHVLIGMRECREVAIGLRMFLICICSLTDGKCEITSCLALLITCRKSSLKSVGVKLGVATGLSSIRIITFFRIVFPISISYCFGIFRS